MGGVRRRQRRGRSRAPQFRVQIHCRLRGLGAAVVQPLLFTWLSGAVGFYESPKRSDFARGIRDRLSPRQGLDAPSNAPADGVGAAIGGTLGRIVMLQVAAIIGGMFARSWGTTAPWLFLIGMKTLLDYQRPPRKAVAS